MADKPKNPAAVALGRIGGKARAARLTPEQRSESARRAALARMARLTPEQRRELAAKAGRAKRKA